MIFHLAPFQWSLFRRGQAEVSWEVKRMLRGARAAWGCKDWKPGAAAFPRQELARPVRTL